MAEERRKGPPERRRSGKTTRVGGQSATSPADVPDVQGNDQERAENPNEAARFDAEQLDASIRAREHEDRGEVF
jgi:hypothetical protein